jgi:predicted short-subunit dehydrogenase-like oxidoreductase (DUF2520 family)
MNRTRRNQGAPAEPEEGARTGVAIIGVGAVGASLARSLFRSSYRLLVLINRTPERAAKIAAQTGAPLASADVSAIPSDVSLLFICTRDDELEDAVASVARIGLDLKDTVVAHVSGRRTSAVLNPLKKLGAKTLSFHPLGAFPPDKEDKTFQGLTIGLEGDPLAVAIGRALALDLGAFPVQVPPEAKPAYHLAAVVTSNHLVALMSDVESILARSGLPSNLTHSLARDTLSNLHGSRPESALTGPIVRADFETVSAQIELVRKIDSAMLPRFLALAERAAELAEQSGRITREQHAELRTIIERAARA